MSNEIAITKREEAYIVHNRILANGKVLQATLLEVCKDLKRMRDEALYRELGYESFEDYSENACGIKQRQAYSYISTFEKLGEDYLKEYSGLGITKLELLSQVPEYEREEFLEEIDVDGVSTRELRAKLDEYKKQTEQLTFDLDEAKEETATLRKELEEAESKAKEVIVGTPAPDDEAIQKAVKEAVDDYKQKNKDLKAKLKAANSEKAEAVKKAVEDAKAETKEKLEKLLQESRQKDEKLEEALKAAKVAGADEDTIAIRILFADLQSTANQIADRLNAISVKDKEKADKLAAGMQGVISNLFKGGH